jgi:hypothetical protein
VHTDELEGLLPTEADVVFYEEHGHWPGERDWGLPVDGIRSSEFEGHPYPALSSDL